MPIYTIYPRYVVSSTNYTNPENLLDADYRAATSSYSTSSSTRTVQLRFYFTDIDPQERLIEIEVLTRWRVSSSLTSFSSTWSYRFGTSGSFSPSYTLASGTSSISVGTNWFDHTSPVVQFPYVYPNPQIFEVSITTTIQGSSSGTFEVDYFAIRLTTVVPFTLSRSSTAQIRSQGERTRRGLRQSAPLLSSTQAFWRTSWSRSASLSLWAVGGATTLPRGITSHILTALSTALLSASLSLSKEHTVFLGTQDVRLDQGLGPPQRFLWLHLRPFLEEDDEALVHLLESAFLLLSSDQETEVSQVVEVFHGFVLLALSCPDIKFLVEGRMPLFVGTTVPVSLLFLNQDGLPYDPAEVTFLVKPPSGGALSLLPERLSQGRYRAVVTFSEPGTWSLQAIGQGVQGTQSPLRVTEEFLVEVQPLS